MLAYITLADFVPHSLLEVIATGNPVKHTVNLNMITDFSGPGLFESFGIM